MASTTEVSFAVPMKLRISATVRTPPIAVRLTLAEPERMRSIASFSSRKAAGCMPSSVAMRKTTSLRKRSVK